MSDVAFVVLDARLRSGSVKSHVKMLCERYPECKGDYRLLVYRYWTRVCGIKISLKAFDEIRRCPSGGTIERRRRELVAEDEPLALAEGRPNKFRALPGTERKRWRNEEVYREYYAEQGVLRDWSEA